MSEQIDDVPDRTILSHVICYASINDDYGNEKECRFEGIVQVCVWDDTEEALWVCPDCGNERYLSSGGL